MSLAKKSGISMVLASLLAVSAFGGDVGLPQETFDGAMIAYKKGDFTASYKMFNKLFEQKSDDVAVNFFLGRSSTELKRYDEALLAFERALMVDPRHVPSMLEIARIYHEEGQYDAALAELEKALENPMSEADKTKIQAVIANVKAAKQKHFFNGAFIVGLGLDTNVKNNSPYLPVGITTGNTSPKLDYSLSETLALNHTYRFEDKDYSWNNSFVAYNQNYRQALDSNVLFLQIGSGISYKNISITPTVEKLKYGRTHAVNAQHGIDSVGDTFSRIIGIQHLSDMMTAYGVSQKSSWNLTQTLTLDQSLGYKMQYFKYENDGMNAKVVDFSLGVKKLLSEDGKTLGANIAISKNNRDNLVSHGTERTDVKQSAKTLKLDYSMPIKGWFDLGVSYSVRQLAYTDDDATTTFAGTGERRFDITRTFGLNASKIINPTTMISGSITRVLNSSNLENNIYQKNSYGVSLIKSF